MMGNVCKRKGEHSGKTVGALDATAFFVQFGEGYPLQKLAVRKPADSRARAQWSKLFTYCRNRIEKFNELRNLLKEIVGEKRIVEII